MEERFNKPRVFLSHSKKDAEFIRKLYNDLLKCQIIPWIDEIEIRHGKPWLESIFENGIPTCDSVLVYLTENSVTSKMVKKEIDASLIAELSDKSVAFLPYVSHSNIRNKLRLDLQSLQLQEWNNDNYENVLATVVAEIWHSFMERSVELATQGEQNKRLKLEIELQKFKNKSNESVFSKSEESDFSYIHSCFDKTFKFKLARYSINNNSGYIKRGEKLNEYLFSLSLGDLISQLIFINNTDFSVSSLKKVLKDNCLKLLSNTNNEKLEENEFEIDEFGDINSQLLTFGLVQGVYVPEQRFSTGTNSTSYRSSYYRYPFTDKMYRFRYWLEFNKKLIESLELHLVTDENN